MSNTMWIIVGLPFVFTTCDKADEYLDECQRGGMHAYAYVNKCAVDPIPDRAQGIDGKLIVSEEVRLKVNLSEAEAGLVKAKAALEDACTNRKMQSRRRMQRDLNRLLFPAE